MRQRMAAGQGGLAHSSDPTRVIHRNRARKCAFMPLVGVMSGCSPWSGGRQDLMAQLYDPRFRAVDEQGLPVVKSAVCDSFGAVPGHDQLDRSRLGMPR